MPHWKHSLATIKQKHGPPGFALLCETRFLFFVGIGSDGSDLKVAFGTECSGFEPITFSKAFTVDKLLLVHNR